MNEGNDGSIILSTVVLNWNREHLLRKTVESYLTTIGVSYELIIVDNASTDGSRQFITSICKERANHHAILLPQNTGGEGLNIGVAKCRGRYLHISENDLEYLPGWDRDLLSKFEGFPELGQLSVFSPFHQIEKGEIWSDKAGVRHTKGTLTIYRALSNVGNSSIIRREIWDQGIRWRTHGTETFLSPDDGALSADIKKIGYLVAWNDKYVVINWGHNAREVIKQLDYYLNNARGKEHLGLEGMRERLEDHGYMLIKQEGNGWSIEQQVLPSESRAATETELWKEWMECLWIATLELAEVIAEGDAFVLVDEDLFGEEILLGRRALPFLEHKGQYWGPPPDDETAIRELGRMRRMGAEFVVFVWASFWWFDHYPGFHAHLSSTFNRVLSNERLVVFDLRK